MKIIVTGGAGFIGSNLLDLLLRKNHQVIIIDDLSSGKIENISHALNKINFMKSRVEDFDLEEYKDADVLVHLAAQASVPISVVDFKKSSTTNVLSSINVIDFCNKNHIPIVYASSSAIYGDLNLGDDEVEKVNLLSPYSADKYLMEIYLDVLYKLNRLPSIGLRFFNVYGPRQDLNSPYSGVISIFIDRILKQNSISINGGKQTRDFIFVDDITAAIYKSIIIVVSEQVCEKVNVLTGKTTSIDQLANIISKIINYEPEKKYFLMDKADPMSSNGTTIKMKNLLSIDNASMTSIHEGLIKTVNYIKHN